MCSDTCIPEDVQLNISVPVGVDTEPDPRWVERFAHARSQLPVPNPFPTTASINGENITLHIAMGDAEKLREVIFFPEDRSVIDDDAPQTSAVGSAGLTLTLPRSNKAKPPPAMLRGVLAFRDSAAQSDVGTEAIAISSPIEPHTVAVSVERSFVWALILAFAGGALLNLMPCVLPVLSIKAFGLVQHAQSAPGAVRAQGIAYTVGVMASFAAIAAVLLGVRAAGTEIGWGFQLQSPLFIALMIYVMFAVGLNLSGVFSVGERIAGVAGDISSESYSGSFLTGALATLVATPCTAPFMAAALGYAITQPWYRSLAIFEAVGFGMALPYLAIALSPRLRRFLPRPGAWMLTLKQFLAFPIYGTGVWLTFVLAQESGDLAVTAVLAGLVLIALAAWLYESLRLSERWRRWGVAGSAIALVGALAVLPLANTDQAHHTEATEAETGIDWLPFNVAKVDDLQAQGRPVFVDFTADWCITCKLNERTALADPAVIKAFASNEVAALRADWTRQNQSITRALEANGRAGVPLYLFYPRPGPGGERGGPVVLPQLLTAATILHEMQIQ